MDGVEAIQSSQAEFELRLRAVRDDQWEWTTPCDEWTVRQLVNHVTAAGQVYLALIDGCTRDEAAAILERDVLGDNPVADFMRATAAVPDAFRRPGVMGHVYSHPLQDVPGEQLMWWRAADNTIHAWDLARAIGFDEHLNVDLVHTLWTQLEPAAEWLTQSEMFGQGQSGELDGTATSQARLLDLCGRRPGQATNSRRRRPSAQELCSDA